MSAEKKVIPMTEERAKPIRLADLGVEVVDVNVTTSYGRTITIPLRLLSWHEWTAIGTAVHDPAMPNNRRDASGNNGLPNPFDMKYQAEKAEADEERAYRRLAKALKGGGNDIPGETLEDQAEAIREVIEVGIANALLTLLGKMASEGKARVLERAESFQDGHVGETKDAGDAALAEGRSAVVSAG